MIIVSEYRTKYWYNIGICCQSFMALLFAWLLKTKKQKPCLENVTNFYAETTGMVGKSGYCLSNFTKALNSPP